MKTKNLTFTMILISLTLISQQSFSQEFKKNLPETKINSDKSDKKDPGERVSALINEIPSNKSGPASRKVSDEELTLQQELMNAKQSGNQKEMQRIQSQLDKLTGSVTKQEEPSGNTERIFGSLPSGQNISASKILNGNPVKAITIQREQIGASNRMWAVIAQGTNLASDPDTIYVLYSDNDGVNWNYYSQTYFTLSASNTGKVNNDEIDAEIVQTSTEKYLYIVSGLTFISGKKLIGFMDLKISPPFAGASYVMNWPWENISSNVVRKYRPRITSDCAQYQFGAAWIYIVCMQDSITGSGYQTEQKVARINNPYTVGPAVTFKQSQYYYFTNTSVIQDGYCDLAYYYDGTNQDIIVIESNVDDAAHIYLANSDISGFTSSSSPMGALTGGTSLQKTHGYIASNGLYGNLMIVDNERYSTSDYDIQYFKTVNGGLSWSNGYIDYTTNFSQRADIMERKNTAGEFYLAYADFAGFDYVHYCKATGNVWGGIAPQMNHADASISASPRPCYLTSGGEQCYVLWSQYPNANTWGSGGCSGSVNAVKNLQLNLFIEGRYDASSDSMIGDTVNVFLRNNFAPYSIIDSSKSYVNYSGNGSFNFPDAVNGTNYYIVIRHRNSIETWSKSPGQSFSGDVLSYDFSPAFSQAYGGNETVIDLLPSRVGIFSGDVDQDGFVNLNDIILTFNDASNFVTGYVVTDITGNNIVDLSDLLIVYNNSSNFISVIRP